ncbi:hypothetical protein DFS34DRAFT_647505 [Phlyctochytrium arcticum]|nr:hypothetical protein DFS34DRAFT_647505 [Phlyctochytrium arcticum]
MMRGDYHDGEASLQENFGENEGRTEHQTTLTTNALKEYWEEEDQDLIVLPSLTFDNIELSKIDHVLNYEERLLFHLLHLAHPTTRIIYITSMPLDPEIVDYVLSLLPDASQSTARNRLFLFSVHDSSPYCLAQKLLCRPRLLNRIKALVRPNRARLQVYRRTMFEYRVARVLGLTLPAASAESMRWGTKSGSRECFRSAGVRHCVGTYKSVRTIDDLVSKIAEVMREQQRTGQGISCRGMIKLDESFAGMGNVIVDLGSAAEILEARGEGRSSLEQSIRTALENMEFDASPSSSDAEDERDPFTQFTAALASIGAIFETFIPTHKGQTTPSAQVHISDTGRVTVLSTHEQIMDGQHYTGCGLPAHEGYAAEINQAIQRIGAVLAAKGVVGHFGVDFVANPRDSDKLNATAYDLYALEINLRVTGTTIPLMSLLLLTSIHTVPSPMPPLHLLHGKYYQTSDHFGSDAFQVFTPGDIPHILHTHCSHLAWTPKRQTGVLLYMLCGVAESGRFGAMFVDYSREGCEQMKLDFGEVLEREARKWTRVRGQVPDDSFDVLVGSVVGEN